MLQGSELHVAPGRGAREGVHCEEGGVRQMMAYAWIGGLGLYCLYVWAHASIRRG